ncbi:hypothetical protein NDU88_001291 [Pleurodeles waltl]|uniref:Uncharacterized protein n=1 Tax=Pleurodeles waltl TaxID=8319 RepID=A0AAV7U7Q1_PLEWA|nr:hypothetical protein NDU88_001291 [Pleurodeles waltl]
MPAGQPGGTPWFARSAHPGFPSPVHNKAVHQPRLAVHERRLAAFREHTSIELAFFRVALLLLLWHRARITSPPYLHYSVFCDWTIPSHVTVRKGSGVTKLEPSLGHCGGLCYAPETRRGCFPSYKRAKQALEFIDKQYPARVTVSVESAWTSFEEL